MGDFLASDTIIRSGDTLKMQLVQKYLYRLEKQALGDVKGGAINNG